MENQHDIDIILSHKHDQGANHWTTPDQRLLKGTPFSTYSSALMLLELGMKPNDPILEEVAQLFSVNGKKTDDLNYIQQAEYSHAIQPMPPI